MYSIGNYLPKLLGLGASVHTSTSQWFMLNDEPMWQLSRSAPPLNSLLELGIFFGCKVMELYVIETLALGNLELGICFFTHLVSVAANCRAQSGLTLQNEGRIEYLRWGV